MSEKEQEIEAYLGGELSTEALKAFEEKLRGDIQLQEEVELHREMKAIFEEPGWESLPPFVGHPIVSSYEKFLKGARGKRMMGHVRNASGRFFEKKAGRVKKLFWYAGSVAATLIIGFMGLWQWYGQRSPEKLYVKYKDDWADLPSLTVKGSASMLSKGEGRFREGDYEAAAELFEDYMPKEEAETYSLILTYRGVIALERGRMEEAIMIFKELASSPSLDAQKAYWYLALSYLKVGDVERAKESLNILINYHKDYRYEKAENLLKEIDRDK